MSRLFVKICGVTSRGDAEDAVAAGADAIGLNFVPGSPRQLDAARARVIADAVRGRVELVGVVADLDDAAIEALIDAAGLDVVQLHGDEPPPQIARLAARGLRVYKAVRLGQRSDLERANRFAGRLLVDAKVEGMLGGSGKMADWLLAAELAASRPILLAGGLRPDNVAEAVAQVRSFGVDVASGVERAPGMKDAAKMRAFVRAARSAG